MRSKRTLYYLLFAVLFLSSDIHSSVNDEAILSENFPIKLSDYQFFENLTQQQPKPDVLPYNLITVLFSDYADKDRFVYVPSAKKAKYVKDSVFSFPERTALIKTFSYTRKIDDSDVVKELIETRTQSGAMLNSFLNENLRALEVDPEICAEIHVLKEEVIGKHG